MIVKLLTEYHLEFLSLKGGCRGSSESTHVKLPHCWKSHALAQFLIAKKKETACLIKYINSSIVSVYSVKRSLFESPSLSLYMTHVYCNSPVLQINRSISSRHHDRIAKQIKGNGLFPLYMYIKKGESMILHEFYFA